MHYMAMSFLENYFGKCTSIDITKCFSLRFSFFGYLPTLINESRFIYLGWQTERCGQSSAKQNLQIIARPLQNMQSRLVRPPSQTYCIEPNETVGGSTACQRNGSKPTRSKINMRGRNLSMTGNRRGKEEHKPHK